MQSNAGDRLMRALVLILALTCVAGRCAEDEAVSVETLVRDLDAEQFDTRQHASEKLVKIGEAALPLLKKTLQKTESAEVKLRARQAIESIEDDLNAGPAVDGYQLRLRMSTAVNADNNERITFDLKLCNLTDKKLPDLQVNNVESEINDQREHAQDMKAIAHIAVSTSVDAKVILTPLSDQRLMEEDRLFAMRQAREDRMLAPGEKRVSHYNLRKEGAQEDLREEELLDDEAIEEHDVHLSLPPGDYNIQILYTPVEGEAGSKAKALKSNVLRFTVKKP
jgi:hypothetical protein